MMNELLGMKGKECIDYVGIAKTPIALIMAHSSQTQQF